MAIAQSRPGPGMKVYVVVWIGLILIVAVEVALTYARLPVGLQLSALLALAFLGAGIGLLYFMRLKYERAILFWSFIPALIVAMLLLDHIWPDAFRLMHQRLGAP
jgi:cytochrome c oxidase subunit IV